MVQINLIKWVFKFKGASIRCIIFIYASLFLVGCQPNYLNLDERAISDEIYSIVGGETVDSVESLSKTTVALYLMTSETELQNFCTGTVISENVILTAAHCFLDFAEIREESLEVLNQKILIGFDNVVIKNQKNSKYPLVGISKVEIHPGYKVGSLANATEIPMWDAALVFLNKKVPLGVQVASIFENSQFLKKGMIVTAVGFGFLQAFPQVQAKQMMKVDLTINDPNITAAQFSYLNHNGKGVCNGDSGGPAYVKLSDGSYAVIGITSWGDRLCQKIGAFTSVPSISNWIKDKLL